MIAVKIAFLLLINVIILGLDENAYQWYELGIDTIIPISALSGRSTGDLLDISN